MFILADINKVTTYQLYHPCLNQLKAICPTWWLKQRRKCHRFGLYFLFYKKEDSYLSRKSKTKKRKSHLWDHWMGWFIFLPTSYVQHLFLSLMATHIPCCTLTSSKISWISMSSSMKLEQHCNTLPLTLKSWCLWMGF